VTSGFCRKVDENCFRLGYYAASSGNSLPTFRDNLPSSSSIGCLETSGRSYHYSLHIQPEKRTVKGKIMIRRVQQPFIVYG